MHVLGLISEANVTISVPTHAYKLGQWWIKINWGLTTNVILKRQFVMSTLGKGNGVEVVDVEGDRPWQVYIDSLLMLIANGKIVYLKCWSRGMVVGSNVIWKNLVERFDIDM
jgi:hypothetical protein